MTRNIALFFIAVFFSPVHLLHATGLKTYLTEGCMQALPQGDNLRFEEGCVPFATEHQATFLTMPARVLNWGSGGKGGLPWRFKEERCNEFFLKLQMLISDTISEVRQSPHDLFHAHLIGFGDGNGGLAAVFHAKEYPQDLEPIKNFYQVGDEFFMSTDASFHKRNFIYVSHGADVPAGMYYLLQRGSCRELFFEHSRNTLSEKKVSAQLQGTLLGDVNIFKTKDLARLKYNNYSSWAGNEATHTGKAYEERLLMNAALQQWIAKITRDTFIYFLTGLKDPLGEENL